MTDVPAPKKKRWGRRILFGLVLVAILVASTVLWLNSVAGARLEAELLLVREADEPLTLAELAPPPVPELENAAPLLLAAFELLVEEPEAWLEDDDALNRYEEDPFGQDDAWYAELAVWVERNEPAIEKAREAAARPTCRFDIAWERGIEMDLPHIWELQKISRVQRSKAILQARRGDVDAAVATCADMVRLAELAMRDPLFIHMLVRASLVDLALATAQEVLDRDPAATGAIEDLLSRLGDLPRAGDLRRMCVGERAFGYGAFGFVRDDARKLDEWVPFGWDFGLGRQILFRLLPDTMLKLDGAYYLALMRRTIDLAERPYHEARAGWDALRTDVENRPWYAIVSTVACGVHPIVARQWAMHEARVDVSRLGLRLELHRRAYGALPGSLGDLVPPVSRADPFRDAPYVLRTTGDGGCIVYSVGPDERDDGGEELGIDESGDIGWRLTIHDTGD